MENGKLLDLTLRVTSAMTRDAQGNESKALTGHLGTHFDVMNKEFPLDYTECEGVVFDVSGVTNRDIDMMDVDLSRVPPHAFAAFYTGFIEREGYGTKTYFEQHPQLSDRLINALCERKIAIIGVDFAGIRRNPEHTPKDQYCADCGVFVVENLCGLAPLAAHQGTCTIGTYPMNFAGMTGLPCRVIARLHDNK